MKIAALLDAAGEAAPFTEAGTICVYERQGDSWAAARERGFASAAHTSVRALRSYIAEAARWLGDCKVLAAKRSPGYYRVAFEGCGVALWAAEGAPPQFVSRIEAFYERRVGEPETESRGGDAAAPAYIVPIPGKAGHYAADLREVMAHRTGVSSREVLLPFFSETAFSRLEIVCDHVPKWFERELGRFRLKAVSESNGKQVKICVYPAGR